MKKKIIPIVPAGRVALYAVAKSANEKTGNIGQSYVGPQTCPTRCPFRGEDGTAGPCYAQHGHCSWVWARTEKSAEEAGPGLITVDALAAWVKANVRPGALFRHGVAGDFARPGTSSLDRALLKKITAAYVDGGVKAYAYTHCAINASSAAAIRQANAAGFTVSASCETKQEAEKAVNLGIPAVLAVVEPPKHGEKVAGKSLVLCPAQAKEGITCKACKLCAQASRKAIPCFLVHGAKAAAAAEIINQLNS